MYTENTCNSSSHGTLTAAHKCVHNVAVSFLFLIHDGEIKLVKDSMSSQNNLYSLSSKLVIALSLIDVPKLKFLCMKVF